MKWILATAPGDLESRWRARVAVAEAQSQTTTKANAQISGQAARAQRMKAALRFLARERQAVVKGPALTPLAPDGRVVGRLGTSRPKIERTGYDAACSGRARSALPACSDVGTIHVNLTSLSTPLTDAGTIRILSGSRSSRRTQGAEVRT